MTLVCCGSRERRRGWEHRARCTHTVRTLRTLTAHTAHTAHTQCTHCTHSVHTLTAHTQCTLTAHSLRTLTTHTLTARTRTLRHRQVWGCCGGAGRFGVLGSLPTSNSVSCSWKVWVHPPAWSCCSSTSTRLPARASVPAAASPPTPLPMTTASSCAGTRRALNPAHACVSPRAARTDSAPGSSGTDRRTACAGTHRASGPCPGRAGPSPAAGGAPGAAR